jgi:anti-sigma factor RsiW
MTPHLQSQTLTDYVHGALSPAQDALAYAHVRECAECRAELELERSLTDLLRTAAAREELEFPSLIKAAVWQTIRDAKPTPLERLSAFLRPAIAVPVASALVLALVVAGPVMHFGAAALPTIDATFYLDEHAAQQAPNPLADRSTIPQVLETGYEQGAGNIPDVAAYEAVAATGSIDVVH